MAARRCDACGLDWPKDFLEPLKMVSVVYRCAVCERPTVLVSDAAPMSLNQAKFERFYAELALTRARAQEGLDERLGSAA